MLLLRCSGDDNAVTPAHGAGSERLGANSRGSSRVGGKSAQSFAHAAVAATHPSAMAADPTADLFGDGGVSASGGARRDSAKLPPIERRSLLGEPDGSPDMLDLS